MSDTKSFIEVQFPVSKISKESYKERKAVQSQTLTGMGRWWGRKPLILVRATILGCILPATSDPKKDMDMFLRILGMDTDSLYERVKDSFTPKFLYDKVKDTPSLEKNIREWFEIDGKKIKISSKHSKEEIAHRVFLSMGYDEKISHCIRPEQFVDRKGDSWKEVNDYYGIQASSLDEVIEQISIKRYGHKIRIGDCFCGGGSIPFESARMGIDTYASDLNPIAGFLTWSSINLCGADESKQKQIEEFQEKTYRKVNDYIESLGVERNENGDRALGYIYCLETSCPECEKKAPLLSSLVIGKRAGKVIAKIVEDKNSYHIQVLETQSSEEFDKASKAYTVSGGNFTCPFCGKSTPLSKIRGDKWDDDGNTIHGLRLLSKDEYKYSDEDPFNEKLFAIRYLREDGTRYYAAPSERAIANEKKIDDIVKNNIQEWIKKGLIPSGQIDEGEKTNELIFNRGWKYWFQLFTPRQLLYMSALADEILKEEDPLCVATGILGLNKCADFASKLCSWASSVDISVNTFYNQAMNPLSNWGERSFYLYDAIWKWNVNPYKTTKNNLVTLKDARQVEEKCDFWITDPPYADAVLYHELSEYFLAWDKKLIFKVFPEWYMDSKRILAVRGDDFADSMIDIYSNLAKHMSDDGMQVVMFTHSDPAVWAQLAIIMWKAGLKVTSAWNIATETDASGLKSGNYVKGTVILILRKQTGTDVAFLDEINADIRNEVKAQISSMQELDDKEEPNFYDPDYVLAAYAASLKALTAYAEIEDLNLDFELNQAIKNPVGSKIVTIIENAKKIAYDCVIPSEFDGYLWRDLTNAEKFFIKGLESEKRGDYSISTYQEFARGFSIGGYSQLMANEKANSARLKTPFEMASRSMADVPDFESSLTRTVFSGIYVGIKEDMNPARGLDYIKNELPNYWDKREMIKQILGFLVNIKDISNMQPHWTESAEVAEQLLALVSHDSI